MVDSSFATEIAEWVNLFPSNEVAIPDEIARHLANLSFAQCDQDRMHELAVKNQADELSEVEKAELSNYRRLAAQVDLLRSRGRFALSNRVTS